MKRILVVGSINMDIVNRVHFHPHPGETVSGLGVAYHPGGKGANQAVAAAKAGTQVRMLGAVGDDDFARTLLENLQSYGIDASLVQRLQGPSGLAFITVDDSGENSIIVASNANGSLTASHLLNQGEELFREVDALLVQNEISPGVTRLAMQEAQKQGVKVIFNPAPVTGINLEWLRYADVVVVNETEAQCLTNISFSESGNNEGPARDAIGLLLEAGASAAVVTLGKDGCLYGSRDKKISGTVSYTVQPAFPVHSVDSTAAGDTFAGAFASCLISEGDVAKALRYAAAAAAISVTRPGAQPSVPSQEEVAKFLREH